ncbi:MAG: hypothetical protein ACKPKO_04705 [Candidatus Fonsibacter sp.]
MTAPKIEPIKMREYTVKQSKYEVVGRLPLRAIALGPSGSGKSVLLASLVLDVYRDAFSRIYVISPPINIDATWFPVTEFIKENI